MRRLLTLPALVLIACFVSAQGARDMHARTADKVLAAVGSNDAEELEALAKRDQPDPWLVADELCRRGEHDAAAAFASASPRKDVERLAAYVESRRGKQPDEKTFEALSALARARDITSATAAIDGLEPDPALISSYNIGHVRGLLLRAKGELAEAVPHFERAAKLANDVGWFSMATRCFNDAGVTAQMNGDPESALAHWQRAVELASMRGEMIMTAGSRCNCGTALMGLGRNEEAVEVLGQALEEAEASGHEPFVANCLNMLGLAHSKLERAAESVPYFERARKVYEETNDVGNLARLLGNLAEARVKLGKLDEALEELQQAEKLMERMRDPSGHADVLEQIGRIHQDRGEYDEALKDFERSLRLRRGQGTATTLAGIGDIHRLRGEYAEALELFEQARAQYEAAGDRRAVGGALVNIGLVHDARGGHEQAVASYEAAIAIAEEHDDRRRIATACLNLGQSLSDHGDFDLALENLRRAHSLFEAFGDRNGLAAALSSMGDVDQSRGNFEAAIATYRRALQISTELGMPAGIAVAQGSIGGALRRLGDFPEAKRCYEEALKIATRLGDRRKIAQVHQDLGVLHAEMGELTVGLQHLQEAMARYEEIGARAGVVSALISFGTAYHNRGEQSKALVHFERARELLGPGSDKPRLAVVQMNLGSVYAGLGEFARSEEYYARARTLYEELQLRPSLAVMLLNQASHHEVRGDSDGALALLADARAALADLGDKPGLSRAMRMTAKVHLGREEYELALDFYRRSERLADELGDEVTLGMVAHGLGAANWALGKRQEGLEQFERAARLGEQSGAVSVELDARWRIAGCRVEQGDPVGAIQDLKIAVEKLPLLVGGLGEEQGAGEREGWQAMFELGVRVAAEVEDADAVSMFLESGRAGTLLESLGNRDALREAVIPEELRAEEAKARASVRVAQARLDAARKARERKAIRAGRDELKAAQQNVLEVVDKIQRRAKAGADLALPKASSLAEIRAALAPDETMISYMPLGEGGGTVALVARRDSVRLAKLPDFEDESLLLDDPEVEEGEVDEAIAKLRKVAIEPLGLGEETGRLLVSAPGALAYLPFAVLAPQFEVVHVPSGTTHCLLSEGRGEDGEAVLALGDPDYGAGAGGTRRDGLAPLPATRVEAEAVGDVVLLADRATESSLQAALKERARWRSVHLACHGLIDPERPLLSSLALTGEEDQDGFLTVAEVFQMKIPADLVVLSACETARGKAYAEGIVGFTRAFMQAGSPRVIVSLWKVDDQATRELMTKFYELWKAGGVDAATALTQAQEHVRSHEKWGHPYYWASWQLWGVGG